MSRHRWRRCPICAEQTLIVRPTKQGVFIRCVSLQPCDLTEVFAQLEQEAIEQEAITNA